MRLGPAAQADLTEDRFMLTLRNEQLKALDAAIAKDFEQRTMRHLSRIFPQQCEDMGDEAVRRLIRDGIERAAQYQIKIERHVALFIDLMVGIAPDFDRQPEMYWARRILEDPSLSSDDKLDLIYTELKESGSTSNTVAGDRGDEE